MKRKISIMSLAGILFFASANLFAYQSGSSGSAQILGTQEDQNGNEVNVVDAACSSGPAPGPAACAQGPLQGLDLNGHPYTASASFFSDLSHGDFKVSINTTGIPTASAIAGFSDILTFHGTADALSGNLGEITMEANSVPGAGSISGDAAVQITIFQGTFGLSARADSGSAGISCTSDPFPGLFNRVSGCGFSQHGDIEVDMFFPLDQGPVVLSGFLAIFGSNGSYSDPMTIKLPTGVTYTSDSGTFLTPETEIPTPEPSSLALFGTGILSAAGVVRKRLKRP